MVVSLSYFWDSFSPVTVVDFVAPRKMRTPADCQSVHRVQS